jgi:hypothetical protein
MIAKMSQLLLVAMLLLVSAFATRATLGDKVANYTCRTNWACTQLGQRPGLGCPGTSDCDFSGGMGMVTFCDMAPTLVCTTTGGMNQCSGVCVLLRSVNCTSFNYTMCQ